MKTRSVVTNGSWRWENLRGSCETETNVRLPYIKGSPKSENRHGVVIFINGSEKQTSSSSGISVKMMMPFKLYTSKSPVCASRLQVWVRVCPWLGLCWLFKGVDCKRRASFLLCAGRVHKGLGREPRAWWAVMRPSFGCSLVVADRLLINFVIPRGKLFAC